MKRFCTCGLILFSILSTLVGGFFILRTSLKPNTYSTAETACIKVLDKHRAELDKFAAKLLAETPPSQAGEYPNSAYDTFKQYSCHVTNRHEAVFSVDSQGMLGGQYWSLVYTDNGLYRGETETYFEVWDGNNIIKAKHIDGNWWYLWEDYDASEYSDQ